MAIAAPSEMIAAGCAEKEGTTNFNENAPVNVTADDDDDDDNADHRNEGENAGNQDEVQSSDRNNTVIRTDNGTDIGTGNPSAVTPEKMISPQHLPSTQNPYSSNIPSPLDRFPLQTLDSSNGHSNNNNAFSPNASSHNQSHTSNSHVDFDYSVVYSGYAGSVSAAPSELSCSVDMEHSQDVEIGVGAYPSIHKNLNDENENRYGRSKRKFRLSKKNHKNHLVSYPRPDIGDHSISTNTSFTATANKKMMRAKRRNMKLEMEKAHQASILSEFRAFLSNNKKRNSLTKEKHSRKKKSSKHTLKRSGERKSRPQNKDQLQSQSQSQRQHGDEKDVEENDAKEDAEVIANANPNGKANSNAVDKGSLQTPKKRRSRNPEKDFYDIPWVVYQNDREEDLSTIAGGSRHGNTSVSIELRGIADEAKGGLFEDEEGQGHGHGQELDVDDNGNANEWNKLRRTSAEKNESTYARTRRCSKDYSVLLHMTLIICSIVTLVTVATVVAVNYYKKK